MTTNHRSAAVEQQVQLSKRGNVFVVTLTGTPHKANVFSMGMVNRIDALLTQVEQVVSGGGRCALMFTGTGNFFSAGFDLQSLTGRAHSKTAGAREATATGGQSSKTKEGTALVQRSWEILARILSFPAPTIAVFNGHAFGLGLFLGLACDYRMMHAAVEKKKAFLCFPEITIGLPLGSGFAAIAKGKLTPSTLRTACLTGKRYVAQEALKAGLVDSLVRGASSSISDRFFVPPEALQLAESLVSTCDKGNLSAIKVEIYGEIIDSLLAHTKETIRAKL